LTTAAKTLTRHNFTPYSLIHDLTTTSRNGNYSPQNVKIIELQLLPPTDGLVTAGDDLGVEESIETVHCRQVVLATAFHQQVHVEVDHLQRHTWGVS